MSQLQKEAKQNVSSQFPYPIIQPQFKRRAKKNRKSFTKKVKKAAAEKPKAFNIIGVTYGPPTVVTLQGIVTPDDDNNSDFQEPIINERIVNSN